MQRTTNKIIIEVKYYPEALVKNLYGKEKIRSNNLYQLHAYLTNLAHNHSHPGNTNCSGILLYPAVEYSMDESYQLANHTVRIYSLNLNQSWQSIRNDLLGLLANA